MPKTPAPHPEAETPTGGPIAALPDPEPATVELVNELRYQLNKASARIADLEQIERDLRNEWVRRHENPAALFIDTFDAGDLLEQLGTEFKNVCAKVGEYDGKGSITLTISVKPYNSMLEFAAEVKGKAPMPEKHRGLYYLTEDGGISRDDPKQKTFGFLKGTSRGDRSDPGDAHAYADEQRNPQRGEE